MISPYDGSQPYQFSAWISQILKTATLYQQTADNELKQVAYLSSTGYCSKVIWRLLKNERTLQDRAMVTGIPYRPTTWEEFKELLKLVSVKGRSNNCIKHLKVVQASYLNVRAGPQGSGGQGILASMGTTAMTQLC